MRLLRCCNFLLVLSACLPPPVLAQAQATSQAQVAWLWDGALLPAWSVPEAAVLQRHILLTGAHARTRVRQSWPAMPATTRVTPVLHVEVSTVNPPTGIDRRADMIVHAMREAAQASTSSWVQLDLEAKPSQRVFYRALVARVRAELPPHIKLSVTALAWWCRAPAWLDDLAADEVVPMFFRMGRDSARLRAIVDQTPQQLHASCRSGSAGFSPQEPLPAHVTARYRKTYWFDRHAWKRSAAAASPTSTAASVSTPVITPLATPTAPLTAPGTAP
jgi:hypothetical protein